MLAKLSRCLLIFSTILSLDRLVTPASLAGEVELDLLCTKFPLNSRCRDYQHNSESDKFSTKKYLLDRHDFCEKYSFNSLCLSDPVEIINFNLDDEEWIRIKKSGNTIQLFHSDRIANNLLSLITGGAESLIPDPGILSVLPFGWLDLLPLDLNKYEWQDHQITQTTFRGDLCKTDECLIIGKSEIELPANTNFSQGLFTVEYQEQELIRSVTFRIPDNIEVKAIEAISIFVPETTRRSP